MRAVKLFAALGAAVALHLLGARLWPESPRYLDLFLVVTVLNAVDGRSVAGLAGGAAAGLGRDALSGRLYGLNGFADTIVGYTVARAAQRLDVAGAGSVLVVGALATLLQQAILLALAHLLTDPAPPAVAALAIRSAANGAVAALAWSLGGRFGRLRERVRRRKMSKVRL